MALPALLATCGTPPVRDLHVLSYSPSGEQASATPIEVRFDKPVIEEREVGKPASPDVIALAPSVAWKGYWQDRQTLIVEPQAPLAESTEYAVRLGGGLAARTGGFHFTFTHRPLAVEGVATAGPGPMAPDGDVRITFNQAVQAADVLAHCTLSVGDQKQAMGIAGGTQLGKEIALRPARPLAAGVTAELRCEGVRGAGGNTAMTGAFEKELEVRPELRVASVAPEGGAVDADSAQLTVAFTTSVELEAARRAITTTPAIPGLDKGWLSDDDTVYHATVDLAATTAYAVRVSGLVDRYGQKLAAPHVHYFTSGQPRPRISMERGIFALEASALGYPVWSRNVSHYDVECAAIPRDKLVAVLTSDMNYDPWGGNDDDKPLDWKKLGVTARKKGLDFSDAANKWKLTNVDLGATCGGGAAGDKNRRGVYLAEIQSDQVKRDDDRPWMTVRRNRVLANVTDLGVLLKVGTSSGLVWVTSLATGAPVAGAKVTVLTPQGKVVHTGTSDARGVAMIPGSALMKKQTSANDTGPSDSGDFEGEGDWDSYRSQRMFAVVEKAGDTAVVDGNWANGIQIWNFGFPEERRGGKVVLRGFIQSDRGLYRPGEGVHFKGLIREITAGRPPRVPARRAPVAYTVEDSRGQVVTTGSAPMSAFGGFAFDFQLSSEATVGDYYVSATSAGQLFRERFSVEEFRPATFEVKAKAVTADPRPGDKLTFAVDARYLFGAPVADAKVEWSLQRRSHRLRFKGYDEYTFSSSPTDYWWYEPEDDYGEQIGDGEAVTDAQGRIEISARDAATGSSGSGVTGPQDYIFRANVTDESDQTMGKSIVLEAHQASMYFGLHTQEYVQAVGMPFGVNLVALRPNGTRAGATAKLSFIRTVQDCSWNDVGPRSYSSCKGSEKVMFERDLTIAAAGSTVERIYPTEPGDYVVQVVGKDDRGQPVVTRSSLWVIGKGEAFWSGDEGARMGLIASKPSYRPGDTARLVAQANLKKPTALVTIERDGILDARVLQLGSPSEGIELPIAEGWAPNVFASVAMVSGRQGAGDRNRPQFKMGMVELKVNAETRQLQVAVELERDNVKPGEPVSGLVRVTQGGKPVSAEVAVSAADEGILQLITYQTPNPMKTFYATWGLGVDSGTNLNRLARLADPQAGDPDEGGDTKAKEGQRVRSKFVSSAYWAPALVTDARGEAKFSFVAPDNLTAFRIMAVAADLGDQFGAGEKRLTIAKPLMAQPVLPRFLRSDDVASIGVLVHNHTGAAGTATVTAEGRGVTLDKTSATVAVPAGGSARVRFTAKTGEDAAVALSFAVALGNERDAVAVSVPIGKPRVSQTQTLVATKLDGGGVWNGTLPRGAGVLPKESELAITLDRTGMSDLAPSLRYLVEYPYGCLEQTLSKTVPLVAAKELAGALGNAELDGVRVQAFLKAGVAKVIRHQQGDGHFSLWPQSNTYPHLTALALWGLGEAQKGGLQVPDEVFVQGLAALTSWAQKPGILAPNGDGATLAMTAFLLADRGKPDAGLNARLYALRGELPRWGQAFLLRALAKSKAPRQQVAEVVALLTAGVEIKDGKALLHEKSGNESYYMSSDVRASAMALAALLEVAPGDSLVAPLAAGLKAARNAAGQWRNTEDNLWGLVALASYAKAAGAGSSTATVTVGGQVVAKKTVTGGQTAVIKATLDTLKGDAIKIALDGSGFVTARVTEVKKDGGAAQAHGFTVKREYTDLDDKPITKVAAGALLKVRVFVDVDKDQSWVAVVDPLPAGLEVVNPKLAAGGVNAGNATDENGKRRWWEEITWDNQELRDDRVQWFADRVRAGHYVLTYQARATTDGTFLVLPAHAEAMYEPEISGRSAMTTFTVTQ